MEENFKSLIELGEEIGLFVVQEEKKGEYIVDIKGLIKLKKEIIDIKRKSNESYEFINMCGNKFIISLI